MKPLNRRFKENRVDLFDQRGRLVRNKPLNHLSTEWSYNFNINYQCTATTGFQNYMHDA
ncbi:unnamed protein product [Sphenostylis stenocarpa]|uniref:Uncharacterized protein n=1 Tax=Sphenostylis stenocarpa TaxID=92480 RepID=A0AA86S825_9FABA|nr:unnamed protein product [Sphenostylis stenocarpa]